MEGYPDTVVPEATWVRALYDYESDDQTSLSFRGKQIIQVLNQLDSGWWDGIINGQRGWFPSNYCEMMSLEESRQLDHALHAGTLDLQMEGGGVLMGDGQNYTGAAPARTSQSRPFSNGFDGRDQEEAAFWIPQCTEDGTLFYFNTLTGLTKMTLPLESPTAAQGAEEEDDARQETEKERMNGAERLHKEEEADQSGSEMEDLSRSQSHRKRSSYVSDGASPATSLESLSLTSKSSPSKSNKRRSNKSVSSSQKSTRPSSRIKSPSMPAPPLSVVPARFLDFDTAVPLTWARLLEDIKSCIERFRRAISNDERNLFVKAAEDISDHLRLIIAAGSGTTDNHSGTPSIIHSNKALYPRFRDMMASFAKLNLNSHISSADYAPSDYSEKCLQDSEGVLEGVYGFIEVARQQRGDEIPRLFPGFVGDHHSGGNWQNNGLLSHESWKHRAGRHRDETAGANEPNLRLDAHVVAQMDGLRREIVLGLRRLGERLVLTDKLITPPRHRRMTREIWTAVQEVLELYRPWMAHLESITLAPLGSRFQTPQIAEYAEQKQRVYNIVADIVISCQAVGAPLADEWAQDRGSPLEDRLERVRVVSGELEALTSRMNSSLLALQEIMPAQLQHKGGHQPSGSIGSRSMLGDISSAVSSENQTEAGFYTNANSRKLAKILGQVPTNNSPNRDSIGSTPATPKPKYLQLDYEEEIIYNRKSNPPTIQGGTLTGLVEQLTRHDTYQQSFRDTFLFTYQSFMTGRDLFERLVKRWSIQPPLGLSDDEYKLWEKEKQGPVRFRVYNLLKNWVEYNWMEENDVNEQHLLSQMYGFAQDTIAPSNFSSTSSLLAVLDARLKGEEPHSRKTTASYMEGPPPKLPKNMKKFKFQDIDPTEFARQLTIIQQRLYCQIKPSETLSRSWGSKITPIKDFDEQKGIKDNIRHANQVTNYMAETILGAGDVKRRATVIKHIIMIADACFQMKNFATLTAVLSALGTSAIVRLARTMNVVDKKAKDRLESLRTIMNTDKNYGAYRDALRNAPLPALPFLGIALQDMRFIEDGMPDNLPESRLINFHKRAAMAEQVRMLMSFQNISYPFKSSAELQSYINDRVAQAGNVDLYELSLKAEPREREDEKIARLLSESGFL